VTDSKIEWTQKTWNPVRGCSHVSEGCKHCYAERMAGRFCGEGQPYHGLVAEVGSRSRNKYGPKWLGGAVLIPEMLTAPVQWKKPSLVFVNSMSDLFHETLSDEAIDAVFGAMWACLYTGRDAGEGHTFQVLTKRAKRMRDYLSTDRREAWASHAIHLGGGSDPDGIYDQVRFFDGPHPRIHLGVSVENQAAADERIPLLLQCPATVRWVSCEPLLGSVDLSGFMWPTCWVWDGKYRTPEEAIAAGARATKERQCLVSGGSVFINWVVCGGESGPHARPMHPDWARSLRDQCQSAGVPYWFKQWGEWIPDNQRTWRDGPGVPTWGLVNKSGAFRRVLADGNRVAQSDPTWRDGEEGVTRCGKKRAGSLLDGVSHKMRPGDKW